MPEAAHILGKPDTSVRPGQRVYFVKEQTAVRPQKEINARESRSINRLKSLDGHLLNLLHRGFGDSGRHDKLNVAGAGILLGVIKKARGFIVDHIFAGQARLWFVISHHGALDLASFDGCFHDYFAIVTRGQLNRTRQRGFVRRFRNSN